MTKAEQTGLIVLSVAVGLMGLWLLIGTVMVVGELQAINAVLVGEGGDLASAPWEGEDVVVPLPEDPPSESCPQIGIAGVSVVSDTLAMTVTVRTMTGSEYLLYEPPVVVDDAGHTYLVFADSLEAARLIFLELVTSSQAQATLEFSGRPADGARLTLIFNPGQQPGDILSPRMEVPVPVLVASPTPTPTPTLEPEETPDA